MDNFIKKLIRKAKENRFLAFPCLLLIVLLIFGKNIYEVFSNLGRMTRTKKIIAGCMAAVMVVVLFEPFTGLIKRISVNAESVVWDGQSVDTSWYESNPTSDTFVISSAEGLAGLSQLVNGGVSFYGKTIRVTFESIDMALNQMEPIGTTDNPFLGTFVAAGDGGSLVVNRFYNSEAGMGLFRNTHSDYINSVTSVDYDFDSFTGDVDGSGTDCAVGAFVGQDGVLYLPLTDMNGNYNVKYQIKANVTPANAWCNTVSYRTINSNDGIECSATGLITVKQAGEYEILAEALDPFTYGIDTKEAVIVVRVYDRTQFDAAVGVLDHTYGTDTDFGDFGQFVNSNYPDRMTYSVIEDYNAAGISFVGKNLHATGVGTSVVEIKGFFTNEIKRINVTVIPTVFGLAISADTKVKAGSSTDISTIFSPLMTGVTVDVTPKYVIESVAGNTNDFKLEGNKLTVVEGATSDYVKIHAEYTNPTTKNTIISNTVTIEVEKAPVASMGDPILAAAPKILIEPHISTDPSKSLQDIAQEFFGREEANGYTGAPVAAAEEDEEEESEEATASSAEEVTKAPTEETTKAAAETTEAPTEEATKVSTETTTEASTEEATKTATETTTEAPTEEATKASTETTTEPSTEETTKTTTEETNTSEVQAENGNTGGYDGKVAPIYYDRYYMVKCEIPDGCKISITNKIVNGSLAPLEEGDIFAAYVDKSFAAYIRCNQEVDYAIDISLEPTYSWGMTAITTNMDTLYTKLPVSDKGDNKYIATLASDVNSGDRNITLDGVCCKDATISRAYIDDDGYDMFADTTLENVYYVYVPYGKLPKSTSQLSFNAHSSAKVVLGELSTEATGVYLTVTVIPVDVAIASKAYTVHYVEMYNTATDILGVNIGGSQIDMVVPADNWSVEDIASGKLYKAVYTGEVSSNIILNVSDGATYTIDNLEIDSSAGKIVFRANVTAQDGVTVSRHTVMIKNNGKVEDIVVLPGDINYTQDDVNAIATKLIGKTYTIYQTDVPDGNIDAVRRKADILVRQTLGNSLTSGLEVMITDISYVAAVAGSANNVAGTDGGYVFSVAIKSELYTSSAVGMSMLIKATEYTLPEIDSVYAENGKVVVKLKKVPTELPDLSKFSGSIQINGSVLGYYSLYNDKATYDAKTNTITFYPSLIAKTEKEQSVIAYVSYNGSFAVAAPEYKIEAMGQCAIPVASVEAGRYERVLHIELTTATAGATIYYTTDGSIPSASSKVYTGPITVCGGANGQEVTTIIRAFATKEGMIRSTDLVNAYTIAIPSGMLTDGIRVVYGNVPSVAVNGLEALFSDPYVYTDADKKVVAEGGAVKLWVEIGEKSFNDLLSNGGQDALDTNRLSSYCNENGIVMESIYDVDVKKRVTDSAGNEVVTDVAVMLNGVNLVLGLNQDQQNRGNSRVVKSKDAAVAVLKDLDESGVTYTFNVNSSAIYALGYAKDLGGHPTGGGGPVITNNDNSTIATQQNIPTQNNQPAQGTNNAVGVPGSNSASNVPGSNTAVNVPGSNSAVVVPNNNATVAVNNMSAAIANAQAVSAVKTGDKAPIALLIVILIISLAAMIAVFTMGNKKK